MIGLYLFILLAVSATTSTYTAEQHQVQPNIITIDAPTYVAQPKPKKQTSYRKPIKKSVRHSKIKRICIYTGCVLGAIAGTILLINVIAPVGILAYVLIVAG